MPKGSRRVSIAILGLGTVGYTLAKVLREKVLRATIRAHDPNAKLRAPTGVLRAEFQKCLSGCDFLFLCVPTLVNGSAVGGKGWRDLCQRIRAHAPASCILVVKSTLSPGDGRWIARQTGLRVVVCPEFISEGSAYEDMLRPHRVLIGGDDSKAVEALRGLILKWVPARKILRMDMASAQLAKLLANALLAQRVASVNSLTAVCEAMGGDLRTVAKAVGLDPRIGRHYLNPSAGFGGSCLEKDVRLLCAFAKMMGIEDVSRYWSEIAEANDRQIERQISRLSRLAGPKGRVALIGLSFKPGTPDIRNSVSLRIAQGLLRNGHQVAGFDPLVKKVSITGLLVATSLSSAVRDAKVVAVLHAVGGLDRLPWINALGRQPRTFVDYTGRKKPSWLPATIDLITVGKATRCTP